MNSPNASKAKLPGSGTAVGSEKMKSSIATTSTSPSVGPSAALPVVMRTRPICSPA